MLPLAQQPPTKFFKLLLTDTALHKKLRVPEEFMRRHGEELLRGGARTALRMPTGAMWPVGLRRTNAGEVWLEDGWSGFSWFYSLRIYHFLMFTYAGGSVFDVVVCDMSGTEIDYRDGGPRVIGEDGDLDGGEEAMGQSVGGGVGDEYVSSEIVGVSAKRRRVGGPSKRRRVVVGRPRKVMGPTSSSATGDEESNGNAGGSGGDDDVVSCDSVGMSPKRIRVGRPRKVAGPISSSAVGDAEAKGPADDEVSCEIVGVSANGPPVGWPTKVAGSTSASATALVLVRRSRRIMERRPSRLS